jgi:anti-sigma factor RsiW
MTVTRDIVRDLLPLYAAGEASAETRVLVETWLKQDAELAAELAALRDDRASRLGAALRRDDDGHRMIAATRSLLRRRTYYLAGALVCTALPAVSLFYVVQGVHFPTEWIPWFEPVCLLAAAVLWTLFVLTVKRLRVSGL